jgi:ABC-type oligopeptide transport system substrate-binding subunit
MRSAISALAGLALAGSFAFAQPSDGRLKIIHETATLRVAYRTDSRPFSYVDAQDGRSVTQSSFANALQDRLKPN